MNNAQRSAKMSGKLVFLLLTVSCVTLFGCEDPGVVGGGVSDTDTSIRVDTIDVDGLETLSFNQYSGSLTFFSAGQFNDPVFGDVSAIGLIKPGLTSSDSDSIGSNAVVKLRLRFDQENVYGDPSETAEFDLVEIDQVWRGKSWKINDEVQLSDNAPVASFSVEEQDSIDITLGSGWVDSYRSYFESEEANIDSLYRIEFPGLAVVPRNSSKIIPIEADSSSLIIENPEADTIRVRPVEWAYSLQRSNKNVPSDAFEFHSTLEQVLSFDVGLTEEDLGTVNISKVELVLYEDTELLSSSMNQVSPTAERTEIDLARLFLNEPENLPIILDPGSPLLQGEHVEKDGTYRFNLTTFVNSIILDGLRPELRFYMTLQTNNGIVRSTLIHNDQAPVGKQPKLIVTSVQNEEN